jgi:hypothetical protein
MRFLSFFSLLISLTAGVFWIPSASAQQGSISISPLIMEMDVEKSTVYEREILVKNSNGVPYEVTFEAFDVEIDSMNHNISFLPPESKRNTQRSFASWIVPISPVQYVVAPGEKAAFRFQFQVPEGATPDDYYGSLNFYYRPVTQVQSGNVQVRQSLGSLLLVSLNGASETAPQSPYSISRLILNRKSEETQVSLDFTNETLRFVHLKPLISLKDAEGEIYFQKEGLSKRVFPGETSSIPHAFPNVYLAAAADLKLQYSLWDKKGEQKLYEEELSLDSLRSAAGFDVSQLRSWILIGAVVLLVAVFSVYARHHLLRKELPVGRSKKGRKK